MAAVHLTDRALRDLDQIDRYSAQHWGERVAAKYLDDINAALERLQELPSLLQENSDGSLRLRFYRVREHVLVCDIIGGDVFVLVVWHGAMDLPHRLVELEPQLVGEAEALAQRIGKLFE
jgi:plasmid stabilization system protein ParE